MSETATNSLYVRQAGDAPSGATLSAPMSVNVAIVGGGFTGLSTALHLAEKGCDVAVFEAESPGWGASGRNGGQLNPGLKFDPSWFVDRFDAARGQRLIDFGWSTTDRTAALIERLGISCELRRKGTLRAAATLADVAALRRSYDDMRAHGMPVDWLDGDAVAALTGHAHYPAALLDRRGGDLHPLRYARGLAAAAVGAGARIFEKARVRSLSRQGQMWRLDVNGQQILARKVLIACNGYADGLYPGLKQASVPVFSSVLATPPLPAALATRIMPGRQALYETGPVTVYYRVDAQDRLIIGGRGAMRPSADPGTMKAVAARALDLWPELEGVGWDHAWNGRVSITPDHLPHLHTPDAGLMIVYGYNGRGVALATAMGQELAECLSGNVPAEDLPLVPTAMKRIPFHALWPLGVHGRIAMARVARMVGR